jgi:hypothetical protein
MKIELKTILRFLEIHQGYTLGIFVENLEKDVAVNGGGIVSLNTVAYVVLRELT